MRRNVTRIISVGVIVVCNHLATKSLLNAAQVTTETAVYDGNPVWSPSDNSIVFVSGSLGTLDVWSIRPDNSGPANLTESNPGNDYSPDWSPDGNFIAFTSDRDGSDDVWVMEADGTLAVNLTSSIDGLQDFASWSPDGQHIAFVSEKEKDQFDVWVMKPDGTNAINLTHSGQYSYLLPSWSPDSEEVVFLSRKVLFPYTSAGVWKVDIDSGNLVNLIAMNSDRNDLYLAWSPNDDQIAITDSVSGDIWLIQSDGTNLKNITAGSDDIEGVIAWSPDGEFIAFHCNLQVCRIDKDGSNRINLTTSEVNENVANLYPTWSADGNQLAFESTKAGNSDIWIMNADGTNQINLTAR